MFKDNQDVFFLEAGISVFTDLPVPEVPFDPSPPDIIFSSVVTSNTAHTEYGPVTDTYRYLCQPSDFISYSDAFIGLDTSHPLLIDITTFANYLVGGILFFPTSDADNVAWSGLSTIYLIGLDGGGQGLNLVTTISYRRGVRN